MTIAKTENETVHSDEQARAESLSLNWQRYVDAPSTRYNNGGFNSAGVQRIDLPYGARDLEQVARVLDFKVDGLGLDALGNLQPVNKSDVLKRWKEEFKKLDLGGYDEASSAPAGSKVASLMDRLSWSVLIIQPHQFFPPHQHPEVEIEFVLGGAIYENRLINHPGQLLDNKDLPDSGRPKLYAVKRSEAGHFFCNLPYTIHQTYTLEEGAVILVLWCGCHNNLNDNNHILWNVSRCQNPNCPLGGYRVRDVVEDAKKRQMRTQGSRD